MTGAYGSLHRGWEPGYLLRETSKGAEGYYLSAVAEIGEPPGIWTGRACPGLGLETGAEVEPHVMEAVYARLLDPRDPAFGDRAVPDEDKARLGKPPRRYKGEAELLAGYLAAEPDATPERRKQLEVKAGKKARHAVMFFDFTFSIDKSVSVLHGSLQAAALKAERAGDADAAARSARHAGIVEQAILAGNAAALAYLQDEAGYSRAGYHSGPPKDEHGRPLARHGTGRWVDAHEWVIASFFQHTSRDGDPQVHVHNAILNRTECPDGTWRTIDSTALHKARAAASAVGGRVMDEIIARELGAEYGQRPDGKSRELAGVPQQVKDLFSSRRAAITAGVAELAAAYEQRHGRPPNARALFSMAQFVTLDSRRAKPKKSHAPTREEMLDGWAAQTAAAELGALEAIPGRVIGSRDPAAPGIDELGAAETGRVIQAAVAEVQAARAVWGRSQLIAAIDAQLPGWLGGLSAQMVRFVLDDLAGQALSGPYGVVNLEAPDLVPLPASLVRADGRSIYSPHDRALFTTRPHLDAEEQLVAAGGRTEGPAAGPAAVAAALGASSPADLAALPGRVPPAAAGVAADDDAGGAAEREFAGGLRGDQAAAIFGIMTSGRPVDVLIGPAGSGKSRTMGVLASLWREHAGGRVTGVATAENAAQVLAAEGIGEARNITRFLAAAARGKTGLSPGDLLVVDEAGMVPTADLTALHAVAAAAGAKLLLTGDPAQLPAVGAGGALGMLAREHGYYQLTQVQRMAEPWEREASLRIRDGDAGALADYDQHGRLAEGTAEQMGEAAYRGWLADHLQGRDSLLIAATNEQAAGLSARARAELAALGLVAEHGQVPLSDGNTAGTGDLVQARRNDRTITGADGRPVANRDLWRIEGCETGRRSGTPAEVTVRRDLGRDRNTGERRWSAPFTVPAGYLQEHAVLGYAGTVHAAQGRTVDTCHAVVTEALTRALVYVAMTRGRLANYAYAVTDPGAGRAPDVDRELGDDARGQQPGADLRPGTRPAPALDTPGREVPGQLRDRARARPAGARDGTGAPWAPEAGRFSVLAAALERETAEPAALDVRRGEAGRAGHMAHLGAIWTDLAAEACGRRYDVILRGLLTPAQFARLLAEDARSTLYRQVRNAELAGYPPARLLGQAVALRPLDGGPHGPADDIARVLHYRIRLEIAGDPVPRPATFAQRTPPDPADPDISGYLRQLAAVLDARAAELGRRAAARPPAWALSRLGPVPAEPAARAAWERRAAAVAAYREEYGHSDPVSPIGREPAAPEARAAWHAAAAALGVSPAERDLAAATDGELHARRARYERELAWAPPHVGDQLRATVLARREQQAEAVIARARAAAAAPAGRAAAEARAAALEQRASDLARRQELLERADARRARWHAGTEEAREQAATATAELRRRHPGTGPLPYHDPHHRGDPPVGREPQPGPARAADHEPTPAELARQAFPFDPRRGIAANRPGRRPPGQQPPARRPPEPPGRGGPSPSR